MENNVAVIILAAGQGTRMKSNMPKVMHKVAGLPMVAHVAETALSVNPSNIITVIGPDMNNVSDAVNGILEDTTCESLFIEQTERLGTGHAVKTALPVLKDFSGKIFILFGDTPLIAPETLQQMLQESSHRNVTGVQVLGFRPEDPLQYGRLEANEDTKELLQIIEFKDATDEQRSNNLCNSGVMLLDSTHLEEMINKIDNNNAGGEYYLTDLIAIAKAQGLFSSFTEASDEKEVMGVNNRVQLAEAESALQDRLRNKAMLAGVTLVNPETIQLSSDTQFGQDVIINSHVVIGRGVEIGNNTEIKSFSHLEGTKIGQSAVAGPYARLRPGAELADDTKIGNFVEIKKAKIGKGSKVNHLSYIGDAIVGTDSNIGAGTITCNYDGFSKFTTEIGDNCFIGSNSIFIAPVKLEDNIITGAGSVISKDVPEGALAIARTSQTNLNNKASRIKAKNIEKKSA